MPSLAVLAVEDSDVNELGCESLKCNSSIGLRKKGIRTSNSLVLRKFNSDLQFHSLADSFPSSGLYGLASETPGC